MVECPKCHSEDHEGSKFCSRCAAALGPAAEPMASMTRTAGTPMRPMFGLPGTPAEHKTLKI